MGSDPSAGLKYDLWLMTFEGVYSVLPTPFTDRGDLDEASLRRVVDLFIDKGANGLTALGVTGEVARLEEPSARRVLEVVVEAGSRTRADRRRHVGRRHAHLHRVHAGRRRRSRRGGGHGQPAADAEAELRRGRRATTRRSPTPWTLPIVVQDYPPISGFAMEPALLARIAQRDSVGADDQARGSADAVQDRAHPRSRPQDMTVQIFGGLGGVFLLEELMSGATGAMTGFAFPEILVRIVRRTGTPARSTTPPTCSIARCR